MNKTSRLASLTDYYPFGSAMEGREVTHTYRYGFQGQETDAEYFNGAVSFKYRVHDARLGRFLSIDPLAAEFPWNSAYSFAMNMVIRYLELEGAEIKDPFTSESTRPRIYIPTEEQIIRQRDDANMIFIPKENIPGELWADILAFEQSMKGSTKWAFGVLFTTDTGVTINMNSVQAEKNARLADAPLSRIELMSAIIESRRGGGRERQSLPDWEDPPVKDPSDSNDDIALPSSEGYGFLPYDSNSYVGGPEDSISVSGYMVTQGEFGSGAQQWGGSGLPADTANGKWKNLFKVVIQEVKKK